MFFLNPWLPTFNAQFCRGLHCSIELCTPIQRRFNNFSYRYHLTGQTVHESMRVVVRTAPMLVIRYLPVVSIWLWRTWSIASSSLLTNMHLCDKNNEQTHEHGAHGAQSCLPGTCIDQTLIFNTVRNKHAEHHSILAACIHNSIASMT